MISLIATACLQTGSVPRMRSFPDEMTIAALHEGLAHGEFSDEALIRGYIERIRQLEPRYHAMTSMNPRALQDAREIDRRIALKKKLGPLAGIPVVIKESVDVAGLPSTLGWKPLSGAEGGLRLVPSRDAPAVSRLRHAGAIILGKTNMPAFSGDGTRADSSWAGPTYSAIDRRLAPGGSSSGTATAVAADYAPIGVAEETGGSIQNPAAAQSLVGIKPTFGLVPTVGVAPLAAATRDVLGLHARTVRDAAVMLEVMAGVTREDANTAASRGHVPAAGYASQLATTAFQGKRIGLYGPGWRREELSAETARLYGLAVGQIETLGAAVVADPFAGSGFNEIAHLDAGVFDVRGLESVKRDLGAYFARYGVDGPIHSYEELVTKTRQDPFATGEPLHFLADLLAAHRAAEATRPTIAPFQQAKRLYRQIFRSVMTRHRLDGLIYPQMRSEVPPLRSSRQYEATTVSEINIAGLPAIIVPAGQYESGSPFALIIVGEPWSEAKLLGFAYAFERSGSHRLRTHLPRESDPE